MKSKFQNKPLHKIACALLLWKGISIIVWILLSLFGIVDFSREFFVSTGFTSSFSVLLAAGFSGSRIFFFTVLSVLCLAFLIYWAFFVLFAINRRGASVASVILLIFCALDLPLTFSVSFEQWWSLLICIVFHTAIFISVVLLRRSRPGKPIELNKMPDSV